MSRMTPRQGLVTLGRSEDRERTPNLTPNPQEAEMDRVQFITHKGKSIMFVDMTDMKSEEARALLVEANKIIQTKPQGSLLTLTDVTGMRFDTELSNAFKEQAVHDKDFVRAAAAVGVTGLMGVILNVLEKVSDRKFRLFSNREEAKDWLSQQ
jgi:hypothetical protein